MNDPLPPIPRDFGFRYVVWFLWCNAITILMIVQAGVAAATLDPALVPHDMLHWLLIGNAVLTAIIAQFKRNNPPPPPPVQGQAFSTIVLPPKESK